MRERLGRVRERVLEEEAGVGRRLGLRGRDPRAHDVGRLGLDLLVERVMEDPLPAQIAGETTDALVRTLLLDALEVDVGLRIVRRRVRRGTLGDRCDEARPLPGAGAGNGNAGGLVDREHVAAVDARPRDAVAGRLVDERVRPRLC